MSGYYKIVEAQLPLIFGLAGHDLIAVLNPSGQVIQEFDGLATGSNNVPKPIGYLPSDTLKVYSYTSATYYSPTENQATITQSATLSGLQPEINAMLTCKADINSENLSYPFLGLGTNSNSVASTMDACMGFNEPVIPNSALITPGVGTLVLPIATIAAVQAANGLPHEALTGDNAVESASTGTNTSTVTVLDGSGATQTATITASGTGSQASLPVSSTTTETVTTSSTGAETISVTGGTSSSPVQVDATGATITEPYLDFLSINGTGNTVDTAFRQNPFGGAPIGATVEVQNSGNTVSGTAPTVLMEDPSQSITCDTSFGQIVAQQSGDAVSIGNNFLGDQITTAAGTTVNTGSGDDAVIFGSGATLEAGSSNKIDVDANDVDVQSAASGDVIYVASNETINLTVSGVKIVGDSGDSITLSGQDDQLYADNSAIQINGADTGDIVQGSGDSGDRSNWGGYDPSSGGYGGYSGGGYPAAVRPKNLAKLAASIAGTTGPADIAAIGADDYSRFAGPAKLDFRANLPSAGTFSAASAAADQLVNAMAAWPGGGVSAAPTASASLSEDVTEHAFGGFSPLWRPSVGSHGLRMA